MKLRVGRYEEPGTPRIRWVSSMLATLRPQRVASAAASATSSTFVGVRGPA